MSANKEIIIGILTASFHDNPSVNFVVEQDDRKEQRIRLLMEYSYFYCEAFGRIYLNEEKNCCALVLEPHRKKFTIRSLLWDVRLALGCVGLKNIQKVLKREAEIKKHHPEEPFIHLWYVGVKPGEQGKGLGSAMVKQVMEEAAKENQAVYLETSNPKNFPFYEQLGFAQAADLSHAGYGLRMYAKLKTGDVCLSENP
jgi:ribosomal protein S18 acetylase RimI-like enzyme